MKEFNPIIFLQPFIFLDTGVLLSALSGFFLVTAQIIFSSLNLFLASLDIAKWPLWAGSNEPPKIPIFIFFI